jgi:hypothetical protein
MYVSTETATIAHIRQLFMEIRVHGYTQLDSKVCENINISYMH